MKTRDRHLPMVPPETVHALPDGDNRNGDFWMSSSNRLALTFRVSQPLLKNMKILAILLLSLILGIVVLAATSIVAPTPPTEQENPKVAAERLAVELADAPIQAAPEVAPAESPSAPESHHFISFHVERGLMISLTDDNNEICDKLTGEKPGYWRYGELLSTEGGVFDSAANAKFLQLCWHEYKKGQKTWDGKRYPQNMISMCPLKGAYRYYHCANDPSAIYEKVPKQE